MRGLVQTWVPFSVFRDVFLNGVILEMREKLVGFVQKRRWGDCGGRMHEKEGHSKQTGTAAIRLCFWARLSFTFLILASSVKYVFRKHRRVQIQMPIGARHITWNGQSLPNVAKLQPILINCSELEDIYPLEKGKLILSLWGLMLRGFSLARSKLFQEISKSGFLCEILWIFSCW